MIIPNKGMVIIRPDVKEDTNVGGIIIPQNSKEQSNIGRIVEIDGQYIQNPFQESFNLMKEDVVIYKKYVGTEIVVKDIKYIVLRIQDVLCKITED